MISLESEIMSNSYDPPGLLDGLGSGCRADAGPATSPSSIEGRGTASKDGGVKPSCLPGCACVGGPSLGPRAF